MKICSHVEALLNSFDNGFVEKSKSLPDLNLAFSPFQDHLLVHLFMEICFCPFTLLTLCWAQSPTDNCCRGSNRDGEVTVSKPEDSRSGVRLDACSAFFPDIHRFVHQEFVKMGFIWLITRTFKVWPSIWVPHVPLNLIRGLFLWSNTQKQGSTFQHLQPSRKIN